MARYGSVNAARGLIPDLLFVNGSSGQSLSPLPQFLGTMVFEIGLVGPASGTITIVNTIPHPRARAILGVLRVESIDAPAVLLVPSGIDSAGAVTLQAIISDRGAENGQAATTNAVVVRVE